MGTPISQAERASRPCYQCAYNAHLKICGISIIQSLFRWYSQCCGVLLLFISSLWRAKWRIEKRNLNNYGNNEQEVMEADEWLWMREQVSALRATSLSGQQLPLLVLSGDHFLNHLKAFMTFIWHCADVSQSFQNSNHQYYFDSIH